MGWLHIRGGWLYQHRPDIFPEGILSETEIDLWGRFHLDLKQRGARG